MCHWFFGLKHHFCIQVSIWDVKYYPSQDLVQESALQSYTIQQVNHNKTSTAQSSSQKLLKRRWINTESCCLTWDQGHQSDWDKPLDLGKKQKGVDYALCSNHVADTGQLIRMFEWQKTWPYEWNEACSERCKTICFCNTKEGAFIQVCFRAFGSAEFGRSYWHLHLNLYLCVDEDICVV